MFMKRRTPLARQYSQAPGVWLVVRQDDALALLEVRIANSVQFQKIPWAETARCGLWWQPKVVQKTSFRVKTRGLECQGTQSPVAFYPLAQR